jgi:hypothetical protein
MRVEYERKDEAWTREYAFTVVCIAWFLAATLVTVAIYVNRPVGQKIAKATYARKGGGTALKINPSKTSMRT